MNLAPSMTDLRNLGSSSQRWKHLYIHIANEKSWSSVYIRVCKHDYNPVQAYRFYKIAHKEPGVSL